MSFKLFSLRLQIHASKFKYVEFSLWEFYILVHGLICNTDEFSTTLKNRGKSQTFPTMAILSCFVCALLFGSSFQMFKWQCYTLYNAFFRVFINSKIIARDKPVFISQKVKICNSINFQIINTYIIWVLKYIDIFYL